MKTNAARYLEGSNAIGMPVYEQGDGCRIIRPDFGSTRERRASYERNRAQRPSADRSGSVAGNSLRASIKRMFEGSEMLCSLAFEDFRGCAYAVFSKREVIVASVIITAITLVAAFMGA